MVSDGVGSGESRDGRRSDAGAAPTRWRQLRRLRPASLHPPVPTIGGFNNSVLEKTKPEQLPRHQICLKKPQMCFCDCMSLYKEVKASRAAEFVAL